MSPEKDLDDNCNGEVDEVAFSVVGGEEEATAKVGTACKGVGECKNGTYKFEDTLAVGCSAFDKAAPTDVCDAAEKDENCDGVSNLGCECDDGGGYRAACGDFNDNDASVNPDALDAPCDGKAEEPCTPKGACGEVEGYRECAGSAGSNAIICSTAPRGSTDASVSEMCDGKDDDCNGEVDEAFTCCGGPLDCPSPGAKKE